MEHSHGIFFAPQTTEIELNIEINLNVQFLDNFVMNASRNNFPQDVSNLSNTLVTSNTLDILILKSTILSDNNLNLQLSFMSFVFIKDEFCTFFYYFKQINF